MACKLAGQDVRLLLRNGEIERFEAQHAPLGIYQLFDQLFGRAPGLRAGHVRDLIALGLVGAGMADAKADALVAALPPSENLELRLLAQRLLGVTFMPSVMDPAPRKKRSAGSGAAPPVQPPRTIAPATTSETSSGLSPG